MWLSILANIAEKTLKAAVVKDKSDKAKTAAKHFADGHTRAEDIMAGRHFFAGTKVSYVKSS